MRLWVSVLLRAADAGLSSPVQALLGNLSQGFLMLQFGPNPQGVAQDPGGPRHVGRHYEKLPPGCRDPD